MPTKNYKELPNIADYFKPSPYKKFNKRTLKAKKCNKCIYGTLQPTYSKCGIRLYKLLTNQLTIKQCKQYKKIKFL